MNFRRKGNIRSSKSQCLENSLWKRLWNCRVVAGDDDDNDDDNDVDGGGINLPLN